MNSRLSMLGAAPTAGGTTASGAAPHMAKHIFVLNPASGRRRHSNDILREIRDAANRVGVDFDVYFTRGPGDATGFIRKTCEERAFAGPIRFYGCGGDGTVNELVNGAYGFDGVEVGVIPQGTGNDYIRNYGEAEAFLDIERQLLGESRYSDLIHYRAEYDGEITEALCANMFNIGFDSHVVATTDRVKKLPLINGSMAYLASVFITLAKKKETSLLVEYRDGTVYDDKVLLLSIANGCFCGGGIKGVPRSILDDGLMDVSLVRGGVSRRFFVKLFPKYQKGTHLDDPRVKGIIDYRQEPCLTVTCKGNGLALCVDGEVSRQKKVTFEVIPKAIRFIVPKGL